MAGGTFRRRRLGRELRRLRTDRGLTVDRVAADLDMAQSTLSRIENAHVEIKVNNVRVLLDHYDVTGPAREALLTLAREARQQVWWHAYGDVLPDWFEVYVDLEGEAESLAAYDSQFVNGLVQTEDYARALLAVSRPGDTLDDLDRQVELRIGRQARLAAGELRLDMIVDEWVLHRAYGGRSVMSAQLRRLAEVAALRNVSLQILPTEAQPGVVGSFTILEFPVGDPSVVYVESEIGALYLEKPEQIRQYTRTYDRLRSLALSPQASVERLAQLSEE